MDRDRDMMRSLYDTMINEAATPLAVKGSGAAVKTGDLEGPTTEVQKKTGAENAKDVKAPEEAGEKLSPVNKDKGTTVTAKKKEVTAIKDSVEPRKSFMDLFDQVMVREEDGDLESIPAEEDDFPEPEGEVEPEMGDEGEMDEGEIYSQLADLFGKLASMKGAGMGGMEDEMGGDEMGDEMGGDEMGDMPAPSVESVRRRGTPIREMKSEPEPKPFSGNSTERQLPTKLAAKGVVKGPTKTAAVKGNDKKRTGELEDAGDGLKHDKSKYAVQGDGPIHKAKNASFLES